MKKTVVTVVIEVILLFVLVTLIAVVARVFMYVSDVKQYLNTHYIMDEYMYQTYIDDINAGISYAVPALIAAIADFAAMVLIAITDLPIFKSLKNKLKAHEEQRAATKAEKAEIAKQERIEKLQTELDELKKDE